MRDVRRGRSTAILGFLIAGAIGIISSTQTWLTVIRTDGGEQILVPGASAVPLLAPLSLAVLALGAALSIAGLVLRYILAAFGGAAAVLLGISTLQLVLSSPLSAVGPSVTEATGLAGTEALSGIVQSTTPSMWPIFALVGWVILLVTAVYILVTARWWKAGGRRFRTDADDQAHRAGPVDAIDSWDELSHGNDPTQEHR